MNEKADWNKALSRAKLDLMSSPDSTFFNTVCFSLTHQFDETFPTAATEGKSVHYNPQFFMNLSPKERVFVLLHETLHCAYLHMSRSKALGMDRRRANVAADHVINLQLLERGFVMPKGGLADRKYAGMSMEQVYKLLPDDPPAPDMEDMLEPAGDPDELQSDMEEILVRAVMASKAAGDKAGSVPGDIEIFVNGLLNPRLPWHAILRKYLQVYAKTDYSWKKPNRRFFPQYLLPSLHGQSLMDLAVAVDASGSVSDEDFHQFTSEIHHVFKMMKPEKISLIHFDTGIRGVDEIKDLRSLSQVKFTGRGGTAIAPVIQWAKENKPRLLIVFTDGEFRFPDDKVNTDVIWIIHNNPNWKAPFGRVIHYELK